MSDLYNILARQLGDTSPLGTIKEQVAELRQRHGTMSAAARSVGVHVRTLQRYASGKIRTPKAATTSRLGEALRSVRAQDRGLTAAGLSITMKYDGRTRTLNGATNLQLVDGTVESMKRAFAAGDKNGVVQAFIDGIPEGWYHDTLRDAAAYEGDAIGEGSDSVAAIVSD